MSITVEAKLWGTTIGYLGYQPGQSEVATFEYAEELVGSPIEISPVMMPNRQKLVSFPDISRRTFKGLPGIFADSLPDNFGNQLIDMYMADKIPPVPIDKITALDRLLYIGSRGMGAIEYSPPENIEDSGNDTLLDIPMLAELAARVVSGKNDHHHKLLTAGNRSQALKLIRVGSSAGGARSKALVARSADGQLKDGTQNHGADHRYWLLKFDSESNQDRDKADPKGMTRVEYIYSIIARCCDIDLPTTDFIEEGDDFHFLVERFDRLANGEKLDKLHYASWSGLSHAHRDETGAYSYEQLILLARQLKLGQDSITELFRRAIFNVIGRNQDDHTKNFGFLMDRSGTWALSSAFDLTYSFDPTGKWTRTHQIRMNKKQDDFLMEDLLVFGDYCNLPRKKSTGIVEKTINEFSKFHKLANEYQVDKSLRDVIINSLRMNFVR
ncbi:MAG: serine/threonine-protein kinase HipA [Gammaproteobacteria bacterium]